MHPENIHLVKFLVRVVPLLHQDLVLSYGFSNQDPSPTLLVEKKLPQQNRLWDSMALAFDMFGRAFSLSESLFPTDVSQCTLEVLRKVMDVLASKGQLVEDRFMWRYMPLVLWRLQFTPFFLGSIRLVALLGNIHFLIFYSFYSCLLGCVHEVLTNIKCPVSDHVSGFLIPFAPPLSLG
jgi:hypothetical protein